MKHRCLCIIIIRTSNKILIWLISIQNLSTFVDENSLKEFSTFLHRSDSFKLFPQYVHICGLYLKHGMIINDDSSVVSE
jgi:hypothetical protein